MYDQYCRMLILSLLDSKSKLIDPEVLFLVFFSQDLQPLVGSAIDIRQLYAWYRNLPFLDNFEQDHMSLVHNSGMSL